MNTNPNSIELPYESPFKIDACCGRCRFFDHGLYGKGLCTRRAPVIVPTISEMGDCSLVGYFPETEDCAVCGEFVFSQSSSDDYDERCEEARERYRRKQEARAAQKGGAQ